MQPSFFFVGDPQVKLAMDSSAVRGAASQLWEQDILQDDGGGHVVALDGHGGWASGTTEIWSREADTWQTSGPGRWPFVDRQRGRGVRVHINA